MTIVEWIRKWWAILSAVAVALIVVIGFYVNDRSDRKQYVKDNIKVREQVEDIDIKIDELREDVHDLKKEMLKIPQRTIDQMRYQDFIKNNKKTEEVNAIIINR